jgi:hypothetical protein
MQLMLKKRTLSVPSTLTPDQLIIFATSAREKHVRLESKLQVFKTIVDLLGDPNTRENTRYSVATTICTHVKDNEPVLLNICGRLYANFFQINSELTQSERSFMKILAGALHDSSKAGQPDSQVALDKLARKNLSFSTEVDRLNGVSTTPVEKRPPLAPTAVDIGWVGTRCITEVDSDLEPVEEGIWF